MCGEELWRRDIGTYDDFEKGKGLVEEDDVVDERETAALYLHHRTIANFAIQRNTMQPILQRSILNRNYRVGAPRSSCY